MTAAPISTRTLAIRGFVALVFSLVINLALLTLILEADLVTPFDALEYESVALLTTLGVAGATVVYRLLYRVSATPDRTFVRLALLVLLLSFVPDLAVYVFDDDATGPAVAALAFLHVPPALVCIASLTGRITGSLE